MNIDWERAAASLDARGYAVLPGLVSATTADALREGYSDDARYRKTVRMAQHGFGRGEYRYYAYPLPMVIAELRTTLYPRLAKVANAWNERLKMEERFPATHAEYLDRCHAAGQLRPTPLILKYGPDDYNCLHQDLYGACVFPIQATVLLSETKAFEGGEFVLVEQRPRMQSRVEVIQLQRGDAVVFAVNSRPVLGTRGNYGVMMRHGVSPIRSGERYAAGIIFHDAT